MGRFFPLFLPGAGHPFLPPRGPHRTGSKGPRPSLEGGVKDPGYCDRGLLIGVWGTQGAHGGARGRAPPPFPRGVWGRFPRGGAPPPGVFWARGGRKGYLTFWRVEGHPQSRGKSIRLQGNVTTVDALGGNSGPSRLFPPE